MADVYTAMQHHSTTIRKRKRNLDDNSDSLLNRDPKRRTTHSLPIRSSPQRPQIAIPPTYSPFTSVYQRPPTPVDTSEDESPGFPKGDHHWPMKQSSTNPTRDSQFSNEAGDVDMDLSSPVSIQPRIRRARSNDIVPPHRDANLLSAMETFARDRVPTPISSHFDNRVSDLPNVPRHQSPPLRTNLSPMFEQESWITRDGLPSPIEDEEMDGMMMIDQTNQSMSGLSVSGGSDPMEPESIAMHRIQSNDENSSPGRGRSARLHMGFLNGCEKCIQKVPGHYSHILRS